MKKIFLYAVAVVCFAGCKVAEPGKLPTVRPLPEKFAAETDTAGIANISWDKYFSDPVLVNLIDSAFNNNINLQVALQRIRVARAGVAMSKAAFLPRVDAVASAAFDRYGDYTLNGVGNFDTNLSPNLKEEQKIPDQLTPDYFLGFRSSWEIDLWGKLRSRKKAAIADLMATEQGRHLAVTHIVSNVAALYYDLLTLDDQQQIVNHNIELQEQALEVVKVQKEGGRATELAVQQFAAQLMNTKAIAFDIQQQKGITENQLNLMLGRYPRDIKRDSSAVLRNFNPIETGVPQQLLIRRPDIRQAEYAMQSANANVEAARAEFLPSLNLSPYMGLNAFKASLLLDPASIAVGIVGGLAAPVINKRQLKAGLEVADARAREAVFNYQQVLLEAYIEVVTGIGNIKNQQKMYELKVDEVKQLTAAVSTAKELYLSGYANYLEVITAQKGVLEAELQLTEIRRRLLHESVRLYRALGGGWQMQAAGTEQEN